MLIAEMSRHTTFRFCLDPTVEQRDVLARHSGASRFAFNQCLAMVKTALTQRKTYPSIEPWTGLDLINAFNAWKKTADAGRLFSVGGDGIVEIVVTGLAWRSGVCQQVFEEAAVDLGNGLKAWSDSRSGKRKGKRVGFPRFKKKAGAVASFRLRNKHSPGRRTAIGLVTTIARGRSPFPVSAHSVCTMTPGTCVACWPLAAPRFCSPWSASTPGGGGCR
jgi:putative transposase